MHGRYVQKCEYIVLYSRIHCISQSHFAAEANVIVDENKYYGYRTKWNTTLRE